jgi:hypothetical protein
VAAAVPALITIILHCLRVPLGLPRRFVYRYTPVFNWRLAETPWALLWTAAITLGVWLALGSTARRQRAGLLLAFGGVIGFGTWSYVAPPDHVVQHVFNMLSPSQDGAFLREALAVQDVRTYLRDYPQRAQTPPAEMRGTRVISNPPGTTLLAAAVRHSTATHPSIRSAFQPEFESDNPALAGFAEEAADALAFAWLLTALWITAAPVLYALGRLYFPPGPSLVFAVCALVSPMTLLFTPGKDTAQLLTVAVPLWLWLLAERRGWWAAAAGAGVASIVAVMVSLVHVWVAAVIVVATILHAWRDPQRRTRVLRVCILPAAAGAILALLVLYIACDANVPATVWAVAQAQSRVTRGPDAMPLLWQCLGGPFFLLFAGTALWATALWPRAARISDEPARLGGWLIVGCLLVMVATVGFTNIETPRLWIPFTPVLLLGLALRLRDFRLSSSQTNWPLTALVALHLLMSVLQWTLMDVRESEYRLISRAFFG